MPSVKRPGTSVGPSASKPGKVKKPKPPKHDGTPKGIIKAFDMNGDTKISLKGREGAAIDAATKAVLRAADSNNDGKVGAAEIRARFANHGNPFR
jgi:hypothetical protein